MSHLDREAFRREREGTWGSREPTARDFLEFTRHLRDHGVCGEDHEPYAACMAWGDMDWATASRTGRSPRRPARPAPADPETIRFTATELLDRQLAMDSDIVNRCREKLIRRAERWAELHGYRIVSSRWFTQAPADPTGPLTVRLEVELLARTDGEWPALHQAMAEDAADRQEATEASTSVNDRLDALAASAAVWSASTPTDLREALRSAPTP